MHNPSLAVRHFPRDKCHCDVPCGTLAGTPAPHTMSNRVFFVEYLSRQSFNLHVNIICNFAPRRFTTVSTGLFPFVEHSVRTNVLVETWADIGTPPAEDGSNSPGRTRAIFDRRIRLETQDSKRYTTRHGGDVGSTGVGSQSGMPGFCCPVKQTDLQFKRRRF